MGASSSHQTRHIDLYLQYKYQYSVKKSDFQLLELLQTQKFGNVWLAKKNNEKHFYFFKLAYKTEIFKENAIDAYKRKFDLMSEMNHSFILPFHYVFQDCESIYFVTEYFPCGNLKNFLNRKVFREDETIFIFCNILIGLETLHQKGYLHLSITAENILIENSGYVKLSGFKSCQKKKEDGHFEACDLGEQYMNGDINIYTAPEVLVRQVPNQASDYYSLGLILYQMMIGRSPFPDIIKPNDLIPFLCKTQIQIKKSDLPENWSLESADFINKLLQVKAENRLGYYGVEEIKKHEWLRNMPWQKIENKVFDAPFHPRVKLKQLQSLLSKKKPKEKLMNSADREFLTDELQEKFKVFYFPKK